VAAIQFSEVPRHTIFGRVEPEGRFFLFPRVLIFTQSYLNFSKYPALCYFGTLTDHFLQIRGKKAVFCINNHF